MLLVKHSIHLHVHNEVICRFMMCMCVFKSYSVFYNQPKKICGDISIFTLKTKNYYTQAGVPLGVLKNPINKWVVTQDNSPVHEFRFSPDGKTVAIVSQVCCHGHSFSDYFSPLRPRDRWIGKAYITYSGTILLLITGTGTYYCVGIL